MSGAKDWTVDIEKKGFPELQKLYKLYGAEDLVMARCFPQFGHNYNQVSREVMYNWFNKHLKLGLTEPVVEKPFVPVPPKELSVYTEDHPLPKDAVDAGRLRKLMAEASDKQITAFVPKDKKSLDEYRRVFGTAARRDDGNEDYSIFPRSVKEVNGPGREGRSHLAAVSDLSAKGSRRTDSRGRFIKARISMARSSSGFTPKAMRACSLMGSSFPQPRKFSLPRRRSLHPMCISPANSRAPSRCR